MSPEKEAEIDAYLEKRREAFRLIYWDLMMKIGDEGPCDTIQRRNCTTALKILDDLYGPFYEKDKYEQR